MNRYWELLCISCGYDLEDKFSLSSIEPLADQPLIICQIELRESATYQPPRSTAIQSQICRFMQEAISAQFHLMRTLGTPLAKDSIERALKLSSQQLDFFLKSHQWHAQLHAVIFLPPTLLTHSLDSQTMEPGQLQMLCIGNPHLYKLEGSDLVSLIDNSSHPRRGFGELYPFTMEIVTIDALRPRRLLAGMPTWQQVRPNLLQKLFEEPWFKLSTLLMSYLQTGELDHNQFSFIQIVPPTNCWRRWWIRACQNGWELFLKKLHANTG